jgi:hypothetical protein
MFVILLLTLNCVNYLEILGAIKKSFDLLTKEIIIKRYSAKQ